MHNPFADWPITGTWEAHASYSLGGEDYPTPYGYEFEAPASGILRTSGGSGEWRAGWVGTAGRRSILSLDTPIRDLVAIVFQHQSRFGREGHYDEGDPECGWTGASAGGVDWGGDVHMHWHGLSASGQRLRMSDYIGSATAGADGRPIEEDDMTKEEHEWLRSLVYDFGPDIVEAVSRIEPKVDDIRSRLGVIDSETGQPTGYDYLPDNRNRLARIEEKLDELGPDSD